MSDELFSDLMESKEAQMPLADLAPVVFEGYENKMMAMAIQGGNIDMLERLLKARAAEEERQARIAFEQAFSRMRAELPAIVKKKDVSIRDKKAYSYAPVEEIQRLCDPIIYKHGFSYSWKEESIYGSDGKPTGKRVQLDIFGYGHTRSNSFDVPMLGQITSRDGNAVTNAVQAAGAMSTYGRRYTFVSGFGVVVEGEDSDGQISSDTEVLRMELEGFLEERDQSGKFKLSPEAHAVIKKELAKDEPDLDRLQKFYKLAKAKIAGGK